MKIAIDAMGGDHAPAEVIKGVSKAMEAFPDVQFIIAGDQEQIQPLLQVSDRVQILHTTEVISSDDEPVRAVRRKKDASMVLAANEVKEGRADACISAGNTGALMAAGLFVVGRISGIDRPALAPTLPTVDGKGFLLLDVGANADAKPEHLYQYALMGHVYAKEVRGIDKPRIGLLNIGTEEQKGNELTKAAFALLKDAPFHFIGNVEARDLLDGVADVVVTDGFTGNSVLKSVEGTALSLFKMLKASLTGSTKSKLAALFLKNEFKQLKNKLDYSEYGGAGLFGLNAPVVKAHGSSDATAFFHAIRQTRDMVQKDVPSIIRQSIEEQG
ncbi:MAG TPA: phosphate acyltransferase PlsX [Bacillus sp. (in: firmicutes)]|uniref:phosphate acyltransferase PlsX n=1 Tax=Bacillus litorisediminis TaxID=2922713 RepID=UPI001FAF4AED|nr:phosphate acyltransferase PlsX [Bacillus litorisediminis]HWO77920.1 phosphate acyltransferase PlsX [Bacillus sp. (in: firmicutes)]